AGSWWDLATFGLTLRAGAQSLILNAVARRWHEPFDWFLLPLIDFLFIFYHPLVTFPALALKKISWT
ncbi:MAG: hypothetical protein WBA12_15750, partial [Catalinimonas sp.]